MAVVAVVVVVVADVVSWKLELVFVDGSESLANRGLTMTGCLDELF